MDSYMIKLLLQYNFIFFYAYFVLIISGLIKKDILRQIFSGTLLTILYLCILLAHQFFDLKDFPDSRYLIVSYASFFYGPLSALPVLIAVGIRAFMTYPSELIDVLFIILLFMVIFSFLRARAIKKSYRLKWYQILMSALAIPGVSLIYALIFFTSENNVSTATESATSNALSIFLLTLGLTFVIFYANNREQERAENMVKILENEKDLLAQNMEIRALYEEMAASEEALRENYDELELYKNKIEYTMYHNHKTGINNRDALIKDLTQLGHFDGTALLYLRTKDLDYYINALGQTLIEILHQYLGETLKDHLLRLDRAELYEISVGRFCILIDKLDEAELNTLIIALNKQLSLVSLVENMQINIAFEIGGVRIIETDLEPSLWLEYSEIAMLEASQEGKNSSVTWFDKEMYSKKQYNTRLELDLQNAVSGGELFVMYQPQYDQDSKVIGAEALLRWTHKDYGAISPAIFIPLAENLGLIDGIGQFVMESVVTFILKMRQSPNGGLPIAINVSFLELINPDFHRKLNAIFELNGITSEEMRIEITETSISNKLENVYANINNITDKQIELHLDDFGTGYSSISHLGDFPISAVKIDKTFVDSMFINHKIEQIILAIIELAHRIDMKVIAEGVETEAQFTRLSQLGCDYFQGYYFARPLMEDKFMEIAYH